MKIAFLYAGQGSQQVGMGKDLYEAYPETRAFFDHPGAGSDLKQLCFSGPQELLSQTANTQPCMVAFAAAVTEVLKNRGITPSFAAGLSLGEYSALYAAGVFDYDTVLPLVAFRGKAMQEAAKGIESSMTAILGLSAEKTAEACERASAAGTVSAANYNCPGQIVIGGEKAAVEAAAAYAKEYGAKRCVPLNVSVPAHTPLMASAGEELETYFQLVSFKSMNFPVYFNALGGPASGGQSIQELLIRQVQSPVYFEKILRALSDAGAEAFVEIGPGKTLSGFVRKTLPGVPVYAAESVESIEALPAELGQNFAKKGE